MADMAGLAYGRITGRYVGVIADSGDVGEFPDAIPFAGIITFTPLLPGPIKMVNAVPPTTVIPTPVQVELDAEGDLKAPGSALEGVYLVATDMSDAPNGWVYRVGFQLTLQGIDIPMASFNISVPSSSSQNLTLLAPASGSGEIVYPPIVAPQEVAVGGGAPNFAGYGIWFNMINADTAEMWIEDGL